MFDTAIGGGVDLDDVGCAAFVDRAAGRALITGAVAGVGGFAVDRFRQQPRRRSLAAATRAAEEVGVGDPVVAHRVPQGARYVVLPDELILAERGRAIFPIERLRPPVCPLPRHRPPCPA